MTVSLNTCKIYMHIRELYLYVRIILIISAVITPGVGWALAASWPMLKICWPDIKCVGRILFENCLGVDRVDRVLIVLAGCWPCWPGVDRVLAGYCTVSG